MALYLFDKFKMGIFEMELIINNSGDDHSNDLRKGQEAVVGESFVSEETTRRWGKNLSWM